MSYFRRYYEAPDDGAGGGSDVAEETPVEEAFHDAFSTEGWKGDVQPGEEAPEAEAPEAERQPVEEESTPAVADRPDGWTDEDWAGFQKQFPNGSPADLWKHYSELRTRFSRGEHKQPEPAAEEEEEEVEPASWRAHNFSSLGAIPTDGLSSVQRTELGELMQLDPKAAAHWAVANAELLTEDEFSAVQNNWHTADPWGAKRYWDSAMEAQRQEQLAEQYGPTASVVNEQQQQKGFELAAAAVPALEEHRVEFGKWIEQNPGIDEQLTQITEPTQVRDALVTLFYSWFGPQALTRIHESEAAEAARLETERKEAEEAAAAVEKQQRGARTATRTAPATPAGGEASSDDIRAAIRGAGQ